MGWCVPGQERRDLRAGRVGSSCSCSHLHSAREVGTTRGRQELARCKSLRCRWRSWRGTRERVLRGLKQQDQRLGAGCGYLIMIRPCWMEAQLRRRREMPWELKGRRQSRHRGVPRGRCVRRLLAALKLMEPQACVRDRSMWNLISLIV